MAKKRIPMENHVRPVRSIPTVKNQEEAEGIVREAREAVAFMERMDQFDRSNCFALIELPNADETVARCPDPNLRRILTILLRLKRLGVDL